MLTHILVTNTDESTGRRRRNAAFTSCRNMSVQFTVPEGTIISIEQVLSLLTSVLPGAVANTQAAQVAGVTGLVGTGRAALPEELPHR